MSGYRLRPVSNAPPHSSQSRSPTPPHNNYTRGTHSDKPSPSSKGKHEVTSPRPWTTPTLRDVDLNHAGDAPVSPRPYPPPPTGHDLMSMFPAKSPSTTVEPSGSTPTSGWFGEQERAYFARGGRPVRFRSDGSREGGSGVASPGELGKNKGRSNSMRSTPNDSISPRQSYTHPATPSSSSSSSRTGPPSHHGASHPISPQSMAAAYPAVIPGQQQPPHPAGGAAHIAHMSSPESKQEQPPPTDDWRDNPDESWRRPMPYNERRRAGKHTKRVIVRA